MYHEPHLRLPLALWQVGPEDREAHPLPPSCLRRRPPRHRVFIAWLVNVKRKCATPSLPNSIVIHCLPRTRDIAAPFAPPPPPPLAHRSMSSVAEEAARGSFRWAAYRAVGWGSAWDEEDRDEDGVEVELEVEVGTVARAVRRAMGDFFFGPGVEVEVEVEKSSCGGVLWVGCLVAGAPEACGARARECEFPVDVGEGPEGDGADTGLTRIPRRVEAGKGLGRVIAVVEVASGRVALGRLRGWNVGPRAAGTVAEVVRHALAEAVFHGTRRLEREVAAAEADVGVAAGTEGVVAQLMAGERAWRAAEKEAEAEERQGPAASEQKAGRAGYGDGAKARERASGKRGQGDAERVDEEVPAEGAAPPSLGRRRKGRPPRRLVKVEVEAETARADAVAGASVLASTSAAQSQGPQCVQIDVAGHPVGPYAVTLRGAGVVSGLKGLLGTADGGGRARVSPALEALSRWPERARHQIALR